MDGFESLAKLYAGRQVNVYRARRKTDGAPVVLKTPAAEYPAPEVVARLQREYAITRKFSGAGVVATLGLHAVHNRPTIVFEDFGGESLARHAAERPFSLTETLEVAVRLVDAVEVIHRGGVIHKDITPANVVLNRDTGELKVIDFGIATVLSVESPAVRHPNVIEGTPAYMSPEQTGRTARMLDYRTDFYSLGVTLYELLTGRLPFDPSDALTLMHGHLARNPIPPRDLDGAIPTVLSDLVLKLMAKAPEDRYQSAVGVRKDLVACATQLRDRGRIASFALGEGDAAAEFRIPRTLYGRERERDAVLAAFERVAAGAGELLLVSGAAGLGKSVLVQDLYPAVIRRRGFFITGKFDQLRRNVPYGSVIQAFESLVRQLLTGSEAELDAWRERLRAALGGLGRVVTTVIPEVELIIGEPPALPAVDPAEAQNRFFLVFQNFIRAFARPEHPLVIFLDDIQWADVATLKLLSALMASVDLTSLLVIAAFRDTDRAHPVRLTVEDIRAGGAPVTELGLAPLTEADLGRLVADTLRRDPAEVAELARSVHRKTGGNPFFAVELLKSLHAGGLIAYDFESGAWTWDRAAVEAVRVADNVVDLVAENLRKLPEQVRDLVETAACVGNRFTPSALEAPAAADALRTAVEAGVVVALGATSAEGLAEEYEFAHDRIQQAAYALMPDERRREVHRRIGRRLLEEVADEPFDERIFSIADHLNRAGVPTEAERTELARFNLLAGRRARASSAFGVGFEYLRVGAGLIVETDWHDRYDLALALHVEAVEAAYLSTNFDEMERLADATLAHVHAFLDTIPIHENRILAYFARYEFPKAVSLTLEVLRRLDIDFPARPTPADVAEAFRAVEVRLGDRSLDTLADLPRMTDRRALAAMRILHHAALTFFLAAPHLMPFLVCRRVMLSLEYGHSSWSVGAFVGYGMLLSAGGGDIDRAYRFGVLALDLVERLGVSASRARTLAVHNIFLRVWKDHLRETLPAYQEAYQCGLETGDIEFAATALFVYGTTRLMMGDPLGVLSDRFADLGETLRKLKQVRHYLTVLMCRQFLDNLVGISPDPRRLTGSLTNEAELLPMLVTTRDRGTLGSFYFFKLELNYLFGDYHAAREASDLTERHIDGLRGNYFMPSYVMFDSLTRLALLDDPDTPDREAELARIASNQAQLHRWAMHAPMNWEHKYWLVEAERDRRAGNVAAAMDRYDRAADLARANGYVHEEALAYELAAKFYLALGRLRIARVYLREARYAYQRWNAHAKVTDLETLYPDLIDEEGPSAPPPGWGTTTTMSTSTTGGGTGAIDLAAVLKAAAALSSDIVLDRLLTVMMRTLTATAGAQRGVLLLPKNGRFFIEAEFSTERDEVAVLHSIDIEDGARVPNSMVNFAARTREPLILADAGEDRRFAADRYIERCHPRSVLCLPVRHQGRLTALVYFEHLTTAGMFTADRLEVLNLLAAQAAVSIDNALLYANLEAKVHERTTEIAVKNAQLEEKTHQILDGIRYAERIQQATLPTVEQCANVLGEHFLIFRPKDIVSGDFYWVQETEGGVLVAVADCTGHGVPGALMSVIGSTVLHQIVTELCLTDPARILEELHVRVRRTLRQAEADAQAQDGLDIALCSIDPMRREVVFAGAKRPLYVRSPRNGFSEIKGDRKPIGGSQREPVRRFTNHVLTIDDGLTLFLTSDGLADQPNAAGMKFGSRRLKSLLKEHADSDLDTLRRRLTADLDAHQGQEGQRDDITVLGLRVR